jgi:hypothetical protein
MEFVAARAVKPLPQDLDELGRTDYERLTGQVLRYGLDGLPTAPVGTVQASSGPRPNPTRWLLQEELRKDLDLGDPS